jgi:hypothetical protein
MSLTTYRYFIILVGVYSLTAGIFLSHESEKIEAWMATKLEPQERPSALALKQYPHPLPVDRILSILLKLEGLLREGKISRSVFQKLEDYYANELKKSLEEEGIQASGSLKPNRTSKRPSPNPYTYRSNHIAY